MTRDELRSVFHDPDALLHRAGLGKSVDTGDQAGPKVSDVELDAFLATINLSSEGILAAREKIVAFLQIAMDRDDPVFGLPSKMTLNRSGEMVTVGVRLVTSIQPRAEVTTTVTSYRNAPDQVSSRTRYWDDVWYRWLFSKNSSEQVFQWDCSRCRPGHRLITLFRREKRAAVVNVDSRTYWVERATPGFAVILAIIVYLLFALFVAIGIFAQSLERNGVSGLVVFTMFAMLVVLGGWIFSMPSAATHNDLEKACCQLLGGDAPPRKAARGAPITAVLFAVWTVFLIIPTAPEKAPAPQRASLSPTKKVPQINAPKAKMPTEAIKKAPVVTKSTAPAQGSTPMQRGYQNIKARCERYAVKHLVVNCTKSTLALLLDPSRSQEWGQNLSESEREDLISGVRKFLAEAQARRE